MHSSETSISLVQFRDPTLAFSYASHSCYISGLLLLDEAFVLLVCLVPVAILLLRFQFLGEFVKDDRQELLPAVLVLRVSVPNSNLYRVPTNAV
jgi:hypothetical protein